MIAKYNMLLESNGSQYNGEMKKRQKDEQSST